MSSLCLTLTPTSRPLGVLVWVHGHVPYGYYPDEDLSETEVWRLPQTFGNQLVQPSPWPLVSSYVLMCCALAASSLFVASTSNLVVLVTLSLMALVMGLWWRDVVTESTYLGSHTSEAVSSLSSGMSLFLTTEVMVFMGLFWSYYHSSLSPTVVMGSYWPPMGTLPLDCFEIPLLNTVLLLSSGSTLTFSHHALVDRDRSSTLLGLVLTLVLAVVFSIMQYVEYTWSPFTLYDSVYGSVFYLTTGTHSFHVLVGTTFLLVCLVRVYCYHLTDTHHLGFTSASLYWHLVDVVWLFLFCAVYWMGS